MKKWVFISDLLFAFFITFLPALCLLRYARLSLPIAILAACLIGVFFACITGFFKRRKKEKLLLISSEEKEKQTLLTHLSLLPPSDCLTLLYPNAYISQTDGVWTAESEQIFMPIFKLKEVEEEDVLPLVRLCLSKQKQCVIICDKLSTQAAAFLSQFSILHLTGEDIYKQLKDEERLPNPYLGKTYYEKKKKRLTRIWFSKNNSRRFFTGAILLLSSSFLVPFPYYYIVFGCLMAVAAVLIRVFGYR